MKIIAFCNIQFICHLLHEKSLTLPNWFCPSFFPPRGPQILCKIWPAISAYLHFTPVEEKNCVESNSGISQAGIIIAASIVNISRRSFTCSNIALQAENLSCHFTFKTRPSPGLVQPMHQMSLLCLLTTTRLTHSQLTDDGETLSWAVNQRHPHSDCHVHFLIIFLFPGYNCQIQEVKDVVEGADVVLECRFSPSLSGTDGTLYWIRSSANQHDNVAIGDTPYSTGYTWVLPCLSC